MTIVRPSSSNPWSKFFTDIFYAKDDLCFDVDFLLLFSVSPEVLGFLTAIGLFIILITFLFWYLNNKLELENPGSLQCLDEFRKTTELQGKAAHIHIMYGSASCPYLQLSLMESSAQIFHHIYNGIMCFALPK